MLEDKNGNIWFGTGGWGAYRYDGTSFTNFRENQGLTKNHIQSILQDNSGTLFFGFSGGLFRFDRGVLVNIKRNDIWGNKPTN